MKVIFLLIALVGYCLCDYVPGEPGAPWTREEVLAVKAKVNMIFGKWGGDNAVKELYNGQVPFSWVDVPNAAKMIRLAFHDCLRYKDGSGGCDGCLNWEGVGVRFDDAPGQFKYANVGETNNNGLRFTVEVLEAIYTDPEFPKGKAPALNVSLKASGKSRADLWALAAIAAVEFGIETNNMVCDDTYEKEKLGKQCNQQKGTDQCHTVLPEPIKFETGRRDCTEFGDKPYKATKHETHPNAVGSGKMTADFFEKEFGFTGRESVAIMGAHTMGRLHVHVSLFRYLWTTRGQHSFNNVYYKNIVREPRYAFHNGNCNKLIPDAEGNVPKTRWVVHARKDTPNGGPVHWIHENYQCQNCWKKPDHTCCKNKQEGQFCKANGVTEEDDKNINTGCERYQFISGLDEMALPCEIGMYFDFNVTEDGIPYGCEGLDQFTSENFNKSYLLTWSTLENENGGRYKADPKCELNKLEYPPGSTPLHQAFDEYAKDNGQWISEFVPAFEKMLSNGYAKDDLKLGPDQYTGIICPREDPHDWGKYFNCYQEDIVNKNAHFFIVSRLDGRAITPTDNGAGTMYTLDEDNVNQLWVLTDFGNQIINVATGKPLSVGGGKAWRFDMEEGLIWDTRTGRVMDRGWAQVDGNVIGTYTMHGAPNQRFDAVMKIYNSIKD